MSENMKTVFEMAAPESVQGQPVKVVGGRLLKDSSEQIYAALTMTSASAKQITAIIADLVGYDVTGKQIEKQEHQYLDLELMSGDSCGEAVQVRMQDNRVRKLSAAIKTVVFSDGTIWSLKEQERINTQEKRKDAAVQTAGRIKKPLIAVIALVLVAVLAFGGLKLFGGKNVNVHVGDIIKMGHYPQTESGTDSTEIEWLVLDVQDGKALVISKYGLDAKAYNTEDTDVTWETCTLRKWLNDEFIGKAFTAEEQKRILTTNVDNSAAQCFDFTTVTQYAAKTTGSNNTQDRLFLLSYAEANKYFGVEYWKNDGATDNVKSRVHPTAYAIAQGAYPDSSYQTADGAAAGYWWLRSPGSGQSSAALVSRDGALTYISVNYTDFCVRPAFWINLKSNIF